MNNKITLIILSFFIVITGVAQSNSGFKYQAVVRNSQGVVIANSAVLLQVNLLQGNENGSSIYSEEHEATTNAFGLINIVIGQGTNSSGNWATIDWGANSYFLKLEMAVGASTNLELLGLFPLLAVPYALHAETVTNNNDSDADPINELQNLQLVGDSLSISNGNKIGLNDFKDNTDSQTLKLVDDSLSIAGGNTIDLSSLKDGVTDADADPTNELQELSIVKDSLVISKGNKIALPMQDIIWDTTGTTLFYNAGNVGIGTGAPIGKLEVKGNATTNPDDLIFGVLNNLGDTIFAVYQGGVRINVEDNNFKATGSRGGFAVGGISSSKVTNSKEFMRVTPDSVRIYVNNGVAKSTGSRGGFAVGGISSGKSSTGNYMYLEPENSFIGQDAGKSNTLGVNNSFIGFQAGLMNTEGYNNVFVGNLAGQQNTFGTNNVFMGPGSGKNNTEGARNIFIGSGSGEQNTTGIQNITIGEQAGYSLKTGRKNIFIGTVAGFSNEVGDDNVFIGNFAGNVNTSSSNVFIGRTAGLSNTIGSSNVFLGEQSGRFNEEGSGNVFVGKGAGAFEMGSNKLYISNSTTNKPLIYGEFDQGQVAVNGSVKIEEILNLKPKTSFPGNPAQGDVMFDQNSQTIKYFNGSQWMELAATPSATAPPQVSTVSIPLDSLVSYEAKIIFTISSEGSSALTEAGVYLSTVPFFDMQSAGYQVFPNMQVGNNHMLITGLSQNRLYYVRSFARNSSGTSLGNMLTFTTPIYSALPKLTTSPVVDITKTTATGGGNITSIGGTYLANVGICWSTSPEPTIEDSVIQGIIGMGVFTSYLTGLEENTSYYVRAFAQNSYGIAYGVESAFTTASDITSVTDIDGNSYNTVQIGTQTWMKENLKTTKYNDGSGISNVIDFGQWMLQTEGAYCWYENDSVNYKDTYGALYNFYAVADSRNICPTGWHVPSEAEWNQLTTYLGGDKVAGGKLREVGTTHWYDDPGVDNASSFTALPGGYLYPNFGFVDMNFVGDWWTSTSVDNNTALSRYLGTSSFSIEQYTESNVSGFSVRCLKD